MRTSASPPPARQRASGFTLLEMVVVLVLMGLAMALVAPAGFRTIATWRRATDVDAALGAMAALGAQARQQGRTIEFGKGAVPEGAIAGFPEDWTVVLSTPLTVRANGACSGTRGQLRSGDYRRSFALSAPFCRADLDPDEATP